MAYAQNSVDQERSVMEKQPDKIGQSSPPRAGIPGEPQPHPTAVFQGRTLQSPNPPPPILVKTHPRKKSQESERYRYFLSKEDIRFVPDDNGDSPLTRELYKQIKARTYQRVDEIKRNINVAMSDLYTLHQKNPVAAQVVVNQADNYGDTALIYAAVLGMDDMFEPLFKLGANPCFETKRRSLFELFNTSYKLPGTNLAASALTYLSAMKNNGQFEIAAELNRMKVTRYPYSDNQYDCILHRVMTCTPPIAGIGHVINRLLEYGADPNLINTKGQIPLYLAEHLDQPEWHIFLKTLITKTKQERITHFLKSRSKEYKPIYERLRTLYNEIYPPAARHHTQQSTKVFSPPIPLKPATLSPGDRERSIQTITTTGMTPRQLPSQVFFQPIHPKMEGSPPQPTDTLTPSRQQPSSSSFPASMHLQYLSGLATQIRMPSPVEHYSHILTTTAREPTMADPVIRLPTYETSERQPLRLSHRTASATAVRESDIAGPVSVPLRQQRSARELAPPIGPFIASYRTSQETQPPRMDEPDVTTLLDEPMHLPTITAPPLPYPPRPPSPEIPFYLQPGRDKSTPLIDAIVYYHDPVAPTDPPALKQFKKNIIPMLEKAISHLAQFAETYPEKAKELINHTDADGDTALHCAASTRLTDLFKPLLHAGAYISLESSSTAFHYALAVTKEQYGVSNYECLKLLIEAINASGKFTQQELRDQINKKSNSLKSGRLIQQTALHKALSWSYKYHWEIVTLLLEHGADPNVTDQDNQTTLDLAIKLPFTEENHDILSMIASKTSTPNIKKCIAQTDNANQKQLLEKLLKIREHQQFLASTEQPIVFAETEEAEPTLDWDFILSATQPTLEPAQPFTVDITCLTEPEHIQITESPGENASTTPETSSAPVQISVPPPAAEMQKETVSYSEQTERGDDLHTAVEASMCVPPVEITQASASPEPPTPVDTETKNATTSGSETAPPAKMGFDSQKYQQTERRSTRLVALQTKEPEISQPAIQKSRKRKASTKAPASKAKKQAE